MPATVAYTIVIYQTILTCEKVADTLTCRRFALWMTLVFQSSNSSNHKEMLDAGERVRSLARSPPALLHYPSRRSFRFQFVNKIQSHRVYKVEEMNKIGKDANSIGIAYKSRRTDPPIF